MRFRSAHWVLMSAFLLGTTSAYCLSGRMSGSVYTSPSNEISCKVAGYDLGEIKVKDAFDRRGGTITFLDFFDVTRIDFQRFTEGGEIENLSPDRLEKGYATYFDEFEVPLVRSGVQAASVLLREFHSEQKPVYVTVMRLPERDGDAVRGAIEYTDGQAMYVVSVTHATRPELGLSMEREIADIVKVAQSTFDACKFQVHMSPTGRGKP